LASSLAGVVLNMQHLGGFELLEDGLLVSLVYDGDSYKSIQIPIVSGRNV